MHETAAAADNSPEIFDIVVRMFGHGALSFCTRKKHSGVPAQSTVLHVIVLKRNLNGLKSVVRVALARIARGGKIGTIEKFLDHTNARKRTAEYYVERMTDDEALRAAFAEEFDQLHARLFAEAEERRQHRHALNSPQAPSL